MAECHPVGFQWVMEAKARGAKVIHVDPRFTRTSAIADKHIPIRAGTDVVLLGALINHVLSNDLCFKDYVVAYTNAATLVNEDFQRHRGPRRPVLRLRPRARRTTTRDLGRTPDRGRAQATGGSDRGPRHAAVRAAQRATQHGSGGPPLGARPGAARRDPAAPPRVFQILKRHYARYTPEMVARGLRHRPDDFAYLAARGRRELRP